MSKRIKQESRHRSTIKAEFSYDDSELRRYKGVLEQYTSTPSDHSQIGPYKDAASKNHSLLFYNKFIYFIF